MINVRNKKCITCGLLKLETMFPVHHYDKSDNPIYRNQCNACRQKVTNGSFKRRRQTNMVIRDKDNARKRSYRQDPSKRARFILEDSKKEDKKKDRENDLILEFIVNTISKGCSYCGENQIKICLDRIDNSIGHTQDNVVPACIRCNSIRGSMPYEAWLYIVPSVKEARINGLFDDWKTGFSNNTKY
jgi:hypothetical protein